MGSRKRLQRRQSFKVFVDRIMALQGNAPLNKFSLICETDSDPSSVDGWIINALERGVVDLDLYISPDYGYPLPSKVLISKTLVRLKVEGTIYFTPDVGEVFLPKLKTLYLDDVTFEDSGAVFAKLISGCHLLEELVMIGVIWDSWDSCSVSSPTLKRLKLCCDYIEENPKSVSFDTPSLVYFEFTNTVAIKYPKVNFDSLVEASVDLRTTLYQNEPAGDSSDATGFFVGIRNVEILSLSAATFEVLTICCKVIPVFKNLIHLTIETDRKVGWEILPSLLVNCPNLETLVFEGLHYKDTNQSEDARYCFKDGNKCWENHEGNCVGTPWEGTPTCFSSSPVKMLKVLKFGEMFSYEDDIERQLEVIKYFLETMPNLEEVILHYNTPYDEDVSMVSGVLQLLGNLASPKCKIQVISDNISFSSTLHSSSSTSGLFFLRNTFPV
ncbi:PREDICTED: F-box/LRR-repeat protein At3g59190-like [Camelina sativa]|nr:PREDICTED: F-box/LRR-repeat protein At3g59190-like [Camelina sativa]